MKHIMAKRPVIQKPIIQGYETRWLPVTFMGNNKLEGGNKNE